jgi:hypothetical protein
MCIAPSHGRNRFAWIRASQNKEWPPDSQRIPPAPKNMPCEIFNVAAKILKTFPRYQCSLSAGRKKQIAGAIANLQQSGNS